MSDLFSPLKLGDLELPNRIVMAPMTRSRATETAVPTPIMAEYYTQRADAGLIVTEATAISPRGVGWHKAPGIFTDEQVKEWKPVTAAVHSKGGRIFLQLWHMGRTSHPDFLGGSLPFAPSAIAAAGESYTPTGKKPYVTPHAMTKDEIASTVRDYATATRRAMEAGFDGVEIHAANGYLIDQFLRDGSNHRTDEYGGSIENRTRFLREVTQAVINEIGANKTGVRLSPHNPYNGMSDSNPAAIFTQAAKALSDLGVVYLHVVESLATKDRVMPDMRKAFKGVLIANEAYDRDTGMQEIRSGAADLIAYGVPYLTTPDLVTRFKTNAPLNQPDYPTFQKGAAEGYTDYPFLTDTKAQQKPSGTNGPGIR